MADILDAKETGGEGTEINNRPEGFDVDAPDSTDTAEIETNAQVNTKSMVGPLQQKFELLKKAAGINGAINATSDEQDVCPECNASPCECGPDELDIIKQNAGIPVAIQISADDTDVEN